MFRRISKLHIIVNGGGGGGSLFFKTLLNFSTTTQMAQPQNVILADYLMNSLGFSKEAAISTSGKVTRSKPFQKQADSVVNCLKNFGLNKTQIRTMVSGHPGLLFCRVDKTLVPKIAFLQELGVSGSELGKIMTSFSLVFKLGLESHLKPRIEYLRQLLGNDDDKVATVVKKYARVLGYVDLQMVKRNILLLRDYGGFSNENVIKFIVYNPRRVFRTNAERIQDVLHRVESDLGIPRESSMFYYGIDILHSFSQSNIEGKFGVLRSFGWSNEEILSMVRIQPLILKRSEAGLRKSLEYYMRELGYKSDYLASRPNFFTVSLERRVKPRNEALKILNQKVFNKRKVGLFSVLSATEKDFVKDYLLPYKDKLPDMYKAYIISVGKT